MNCRQEFCENKCQYVFRNELPLLANTKLDSVDLRLLESKSVKTHILKYNRTNIK